MGSNCFDSWIYLFYWWSSGPRHQFSCPHDSVCYELMTDSVPVCALDCWPVLWSLHNTSIVAKDWVLVSKMHLYGCGTRISPWIAQFYRYMYDIHVCMHYMFSWISRYINMYVVKHNQFLSWSLWSLQLPFYLYNSMLVNLLGSCNCLFYLWNTRFRFPIYEWSSMQYQLH